MKPIIVYRFFLFRLWGWIRGMTIYPFILFKFGRDEVDDVVFRHELEHIYQVEKTGWLRFYASYLWENIAHGYRSNKWEVAARAVENTPLTTYERKLKDS